jgi:hypothetical protein
LEVESVIGGHAFGEKVRLRGGRYEKSTGRWGFKMRGVCYGLGTGGIDLPCY